MGQDSAWGIHLFVPFCGEAKNGSTVRVKNSIVARGVSVSPSKRRNEANRGQRCCQREQALPFLAAAVFFLGRHQATTEHDAYGPRYTRRGMCSETSTSNQRQQRHPPVSEESFCGVGAHVWRCTGLHCCSSPGDSDENTQTVERRFWLREGRRSGLALCLQQVSRAKGMCTASLCIEQCHIFALKVFGRRGGIVECASVKHKFQRTLYCCRPKCSISSCFMGVSAAALLMSAFPLTSRCPCIFLGMYHPKLAGGNEREDEHRSPGRAAQVRPAGSAQQVSHMREHHVRGKPRLGVLVSAAGGKLSDSPANCDVGPISLSATPQV